MEFELLRDLARAVNRNNSKNIEILSCDNQKKTKLNLLYTTLLSNEFKTEKEAVRHLFKSYDTKYPSYVNLKNKLIRQLVNSALFIDVNTPTYDERARSYFNSYKDFAAAVVLLSRGGCISAIYILNTILEQAIKYDFIDLIADVSKWLRLQYSSENFNVKKHKYYAEIQRKYEKKRYYESLAFDYYENLVGYYLERKAPNQTVSKMASSYLNELIPLLEEVDTPMFYSHTFKIQLIKNSSIGNYQNAVDTCDVAIDVMKKRGNAHRSTLALFTLEKMFFFTQLRKIDHASIDELFDNCMQFYPEGDFTWFRTNEVYLCYCISTKRYIYSLSVYEKAIQNSRFDNLLGIYRDNWLLLGGYLHFLAKTGKLDPAQVTEIVGPFRYSKLFNEIEILKKDKEGMNIPLILLPVLYEFAQEPSKSIKEIPVDALEKYRQRWLMRDMNKRSNCFFKMIIALAKDDNFSAATQRKINKEYEILKNETPEVSRQNFAIEVIPYEDLWEMLISARFPAESDSFTTVKEVNHSLRSIEPPRSSPQL